MTTNEILTLAISSVAVVFTGINFYQASRNRKQDSRRYLLNEKTNLIKECDSFFRDIRILQLRLETADVQKSPEEILEVYNQMKMDNISLIEENENFRQLISDEDYKSLNKLNEHRNGLNKTIESYNVLKVRIDYMLKDMLSRIE